MKFKSDIPDGSSSKHFIKLKDKESITGIFRGEPFEFYTLWENGKSRIVPEGTPKAGFRFRINFVVKDGPVYVPKIFENGPMIYKQLAELNDEYGLDSVVMKITRNGTGLDTTYSLFPLLKQAISPETLKHLDALDLLKLDQDSGNLAPPGGPNDEMGF